MCACVFLRPFQTKNSICFIHTLSKNGNKREELYIHVEHRGTGSVKKTCSSHPRVVVNETHYAPPPKKKKLVKYQNAIHACSSWCATVEFIIYYDMSFGVHMHTSGSFCYGTQCTYNTFDLVMSLDLSRHRRQISQRHSGWLSARSSVLVQALYSALGLSNGNEILFREKSSVLKIILIFFLVTPSVSSLPRGLKNMTAWLFWAFAGLYLLHV